jgi:AcrR family transcriptional regulator
METTKKAKSKSASDASAEKISKAYRDFVLTEGKQPASVFKFCKDLGVTEDAFYQHFASFDALDKNIWKGYIETTQKRLESDESYASLSTREKILTFYFALAEVLKSDRSFVLMHLALWKNPALPPKFLKSFKAAFEDWITGVLSDGKTSGEIAKRPFLDKRYHQIFSLHLIFILQFWGKDESANFENTDAAIEKSVNLAFDLIGKGVLDNAIDFGKFLYQTSKA